jgi:hypothetical protein
MRGDGESFRLGWRVTMLGDRGSAALSKGMLGFKVLNPLAWQLVVLQSVS